MGELKYRYPGPQPFELGQSSIFFGRNHDIQHLKELIDLEKMVLLYGKSGLGKSSLINAGLMPEILDENKYDPIRIRFGPSVEGKTESPLDVSINVLKEKYIDSENQSWLNILEPEGKSKLWFELKKNQAKKSKGYLLIFDQFEELFTYPEQDVIEYAGALADLLYKEIPDAVRDKLDAALDMNEDVLTEEQEDILYEKPDVKLLIAIRSDRMSYLNRLKPYLSDILTYTYELAPLNSLQAEEAIIQPAAEPKYNGRKQEIFKTPSFEYEEKSLRHILDFLSKGNHQKIESFQLQILCQHIEELVDTYNFNPVTIKDIGDLKEIYEKYYSNKINEIKSEQERLMARKMIEEEMIFEEEERRLPIYEGKILKFIQLDTLRLLVNSHLLRAEPSMQGGFTYELSHDTLVVPVLKAKKEREGEERKITSRLERERIEAEKEELRKEAILERQRADREMKLKVDAENKQKKASLFFRIALFFLIITALLSVLAIQTNMEVQRTNRELNEAKDKVVAARDEALIAKIKTEKALDKLIFTQRKSKAREMYNYAKGYEETGERSLACRKLMEARDSLGFYPDDELYLEVSVKIKKMSCN